LIIGLPPDRKIRFSATEKIYPNPRRQVDAREFLRQTQIVKSPLARAAVMHGHALCLHAPAPNPAPGMGVSI
jgi:hypothetical protein